MNIFKKVMFMFIALGMVLGVLACRNNAGGGDEPVPVVKTLDKLVITGDSVQKIAVEKDTDLTVNPISTKGIKINALYNTGEILSTKQDDFTSDGWSVDFSGIDTNNDGTEDVENETDKTDNGGYTLPIKFSYTHEGKTVSIELFVRVIDSNNFEKIEIVDYSRVKEFDIGDAFDPFGLVVKVVLDSTPGQEDAFEVIDFSDTNKWTFETTADSGSVDTSTENDALPVTVKYTTTSKSATADFPIVVFDGDDVASIEITQQPDKKTYDYDATPITELDLTGLNVKMILKKGNREVIVNDWSNVNQTGSKWTYIGFDSSQETTQEITLMYTTRGGKIYEVKFNVTVEGTKVVGITLVTEPTDKQYIIGETFNPTGLRIKVNHLNAAHDFDFNPTDVSEFTGRWELNGWSNGDEKEGMLLKVRYMNEAGDGILGEVSFTVDMFAITNITMTEPPAHEKVYFEGEDVQYVRDLYLPKAVVELALKAEGKTSTDTYPITDPIFKSYSITATGDVNATGDKFEIQPGSMGSANVKCRVVVTDALWFEPTFPVTVVKKYDFHETIEKFTGDLPGGVSVQNDDLYATGTPCNVLDTVLKFVTFGDYPQTLAKIEGSDVGKDLHIYQITERKKQGTGGMDMYLGSDGGYYVKVKAKRHNELGKPENFPPGMSPGDQYNFVDTKGNTVKHSEWNNQTCWFRVEPLLWRVLDTEYKGAGTETIGALLWSVKAVERMPYFADADSPDVSGQGGKSSRTDKNNGEIKWYSYKYSTLRAFLRGEYEDDDEQAGLAYKQVLTGEGENEELVGKFNVAGEKLGFLQRAFTQDARSHLKQVDLGEGMNDYVFVLSKDELTKSEADYYFISVGKGSEQADAQQQRAKNPTQYAMAREAKRWSYKNNDVDFSYPGSSSWTRTSGGYGVSAVTGFGHMLYNVGGGGTSIGRGAFKDGTVVPAICVDAGEITKCFP